MNEWYLKNKERILQKSKEYYQENKDKKKQYHINNKEKIKKYKKQRKINNPDKIKEQEKKWHLENREYSNLYSREKYKNNINYKLSMLLRSRLYKSVKTHKIESSLNMLGCDLEELKNYLEKQFREEMNWGNYGKVWEIDHIKPCSKFNLASLEEQKQCFHYSNLQPLFKSDNRKKSNKYEYTSF